MRPASLPVTRREPRRPARKRPVGISIFLWPFPLPRRGYTARAIPRAKAAPVGRQARDAAFDSFVLLSASVGTERSNDR